MENSCGRAIVDQGDRADVSASKALPAQLSPRCDWICRPMATGIRPTNTLSADVFAGVAVVPVPPGGDTRYHLRALCEHAEFYLKTISRKISLPTTFLISFRCTLAWF